MPALKTAPDLMATPGFKEFIDGFGEIVKASSEISLDEGRRLCTQYFLAAANDHEPVDRIKDIEIISKDGAKVPMRLFIPDSALPLPILLFFHRGGWVFGSIEEADPLCRKFANHFNCLVASVGFRLSPEHPFPKPLEDCYAATEWMAENGRLFGGDNRKIVVCGESAGGNLAAATALMARDNKRLKISAQLLINPIITSTIHDAPYDSSPDIYFITKEAIRFFWSSYLQTPENASHPYASVELANLEGLPPALIVTADYDPLAEEARLFAQKLQAAGVETVTKNFPEVIHGFLDLPIYEEHQKLAWLAELGQLLAHTLELGFAHK